MGCPRVGLVPRPNLGLCDSTPLALVTDLVAPALRNVGLLGCPDADHLSQSRARRDPLGSRPKSSRESQRDSVPEPRVGRGTRPALGPRSHSDTNRNVVVAVRSDQFQTMGSRINLVHLPRYPYAAELKINSVDATPLPPATVTRTSPPRSMCGQAQIAAVRNACHGPVMATVTPGVWMFTNSVVPSGEKHAPVNSPSVVRASL